MTRPYLAIAMVVIMLLLLIPVWGCEEDPTSASTPMYSEVADTSFAVGSPSILGVENFVGNVTVLTGDSDTISVIVTRWAGRVEDLSKIEVEVGVVVGGVSIVTGNPLRLNNVSVDLEITAPPDVRPTIHNGVGSTSYVGQPMWLSRFYTGVGSVKLSLPADVNVKLNLSTGVGSITVGFPVTGQVSQHLVIGDIGTPLDGEIQAQVGTGSIEVVSQ